MVFRKFAWFLCALFVIVFFGDSLLHGIGTILHILIEVLEMALEHFLESAFGLHGHPAQMVTAWTGLTAFLILGFVLYRQARKSLQRYAADWERFRGEAVAAYHRLRKAWPGIVACGVGAAALYFLFT